MRRSAVAMAGALLAGCGGSGDPRRPATMPPASGPPTRPSERSPSSTARMPTTGGSSVRRAGAASACAGRRSAPPHRPSDGGWRSAWATVDACRSSAGPRGAAPASCARAPGRRSSTSCGPPQTASSGSPARTRVEAVLVDVDPVAMRLRSGRSVEGAVLATHAGPLGLTAVLAPPGDIGEARLLHVDPRGRLRTWRLPGVAAGTRIEEDRAWLLRERTPGLAVKRCGRPRVRRRPRARAARRRGGPAQRPHGRARGAPATGPARAPARCARARGGGEGGRPGVAAGALARRWPARGHRRRRGLRPRHGRPADGPRGSADRRRAHLGAAVGRPRGDVRGPRALDLATGRPAGRPLPPAQVAAPLP